MSDWIVNHLKCILEGIYICFFMVGLLKRHEVSKYKYLLTTFVNFFFFFNAHCTKSSYLIGWILTS